MIFNVNSALNYILDETKPQYLRAVKLHVLQVAIVNCRGLAVPKNEKSFKIKVRRSVINSSRALISAKIVEYRIGELRQRFNEKHLFLNIMLDELLRPLIKNLLLSRGIHKLKYSNNPHEVDYDTWLMRRRAASVACVYDYSLRYVPLCDKDEAGRITRALNIVYGNLDSRISNHWRQKYHKIDAVKKHERNLRPVAPFLFLAYYQKHLIRPGYVRKYITVRRLLKLVGERRALIEWLSVYNGLASRLEARGYSCPPITVAHPVPQGNVSFHPLPEFILDYARNSADLTRR